MKATFRKKILVIAIATACLSRGTQRARSKSCAVLAAMLESHCTVGDLRIKGIFITAVVEDYKGKSGREKIIPPVKDITSYVSACLSQGTEDDAACLSLRDMGEQSKMLMACLSKAMEEQNLVEDHRARREDRDTESTHHRLSDMY